jgi:hypothetical protein
MTRYTVAPIADENCDSLADHTILLRTDDAIKAKAAAEAENHNFIFGTGILDTQSQPSLFGVENVTEGFTLVPRTRPEIEKLIAKRGLVFVGIGGEG